MKRYLIDVTVECHNTLLHWLTSGGKCNITKKPNFISKVVHKFSVAIKVMLLKVTFSPAEQHEALFWLTVSLHGVSAAWQQLLQRWTVRRHHRDTADKSRGHVVFEH